jgi:chromosome segregation ATPase
MKRALILVLFCGAIVSLALAQQPESTGVPAAPPPPETAGPVDIARPGQTATTPVGMVAATPAGPADTTPTESVETTMPGMLGKTPAVVADTQEARELPLDSEPFDVRVHRRVTEYSQRHQQRERHMSSYDQVSVGDPGLERFADPRKVQVELSDELDRERTSEELGADYAEQAHDVQSKAQALQEFIAKRRQTLDELNKHDGALRRHDLEVALANLARQPLSPETLAAMRELDRRLSETDRNEKDLPAQLSQNQQETADAAEEFAKLQALQQAYEKEAKAFTADALSARQNRLRLASKLEYFVVRAQAEDTLEQGRKALETVEHLSPSSQVENLLRGPGSTTKSDAHLEQMRDCINKSGDVQACRQATHRE